MFTNFVHRRLDGLQKCAAQPLAFVLQRLIVQFNLRSRMTPHANLTRRKLTAPIWPNIVLGY